MTGLSIALVNLKPGTGKTTSAVWLAHVFAEAGNTVLLVDADPSGSALEWSDFAAMDPRLPPQAAFPFRIVALPSRDLHRRVPEVARPDDVVIIDAPQLEDHAGIARSALRYADEILIPCAPSPIEINRTTPVRDEITDAGAARDRPARAAVLLNRCVTRANSTGYARAALEGLGYDVLGTAVPRLEVYAQSFGIPIPVRGRGVWGRVARDLAGRCVPLRSAASLPGRRSSAKCCSQPRRGVHCRVSRPGCAREILQPDGQGTAPSRGRLLDLRRGSCWEPVTWPPIPRRAQASDGFTCAQICG
jgi:chromosome partitioning protein